MVQFAQRIKDNSSFPKTEALSRVLTLGKVELHFETLRKLHHKPWNNGWIWNVARDQSEGE